MSSNKNDEHDKSAEESTSDFELDLGADEGVILDEDKEEEGADELDVASIDELSQSSEGKVEEGVSLFQQQELNFEDDDESQEDQELISDDDSLASMFEDDDESAEESSDSERVLSSDELRVLDLEESLTLEGQIEALVFASPVPIKGQDIRDLLSDEDNEIPLKEVEATLQSLQKLYDERAGGFRLIFEQGRGYQFQTVPAACFLMERMFSSRPRPLSRAALETLSIIAYRQPSTRAEIEYIRGVDAGSIIKNLMDRGLIECVGRKEDSGRPMLFGTTQEFLKVFRIQTLDQLPPLASFQPPPETAEASQQDPVEAIDVEDFIGDEEEQAHSVSEGLIDRDVAEIDQEDSGSSGQNELDSEGSLEIELSSADPEPEIEGASTLSEEIRLEGENGALETTEVDIPVGDSVPEGSREVDSGGES